MSLNNKQRYSLPINFSVNGEISNDDGRFLKVTIDAMHLGENYNGSIFNKEVVEENLETVKNTPILGFVCADKFSDEKDFKGHEYIITKTDKDGITREYIGSAYGIVPESCNPRWNIKLCDDGIEREFLQVDALMWTKFKDSTSILERDSEKPESMELYSDSVEGYENEDGKFVFTKFSFDGFCILGDDIEPAMEGANIKLNSVNFSMDDFTKSIQEELNNKFTTFTKLVGEQKEKGGIDNMPKTDFMQTVLEQFEDISNIVSQKEVVKDRWGDEVPRYYLKDIQENEIIVVDRTDSYHVYGFQYTMNGDKAEIDFECGKRKKTTYTDYEEGSAEPENNFDFGNHISEIEDSAFEKVSEVEGKISEYEKQIEDAKEKITEAETNYTTVKSEYDEIKPKYDEYVKEEQERIESELEAQKDAEFAKYEAILSDNEDFTALKEKKSEMSVKEIEGECSILYARKTLATDFSKIESNDALTSGILDNEDDNEGYVATKYGNIPVRG